MVRGRMTWSGLALLLALVLAACSGPIVASPPTSAGPPLASATPRSVPSAPPMAVVPTDPASLSADQRAALNSLAKVDDYPLYTMRYRHSYVLTEGDRLAMTGSNAGGGCSLFAAFADRGNVLYGRNFDWNYSPGLLLFYTPDDGYPSVAMTALSFIDFRGRPLDALHQASLAERQPLLAAAVWTFDGMNAKGLVVGWARVPAGKAPYDPANTTAPSVFLTRAMLDRAATVDEAIEIVRSYNVSFGPSMPLHYVVADRSGRSALLEFLDGKLVVTRNEKPWQTAVNFLPQYPGVDPDVAAWRLDILTRELDKVNGSLTTASAMGMLERVQDHTQWSVVYHPNTGDVEIAMGMDYRNVHTFHLDMQP